MKVVLLQDIKNVGKRGDIKEVSDGYARNFLLPKKMVEAATETTVKKVEFLKAQQQEEEKINSEKNQELVRFLKEKKITIGVKEKKGKLFGSITAKNIIRELKKENIELPEKSIMLAHPIKETGEYEVKINLDHGIEAPLKVIIESSQQK